METMEQATPKAPPPPAIPGLEQGNPQVSNRAQSAQQAQPGQAAPPSGTTTGQPGIPGGDGRVLTPNELRDQIRENVRRSVQNTVRNGGPGGGFNGGGPNPNWDGNLDFRNAVPEGAVIISVAFFVSVAATIIFAPLARAFARRVDRQSEAALKSAAAVSPQLMQLQDSMDALSVEVERITEAQRFQSKLLAERAKEPARAGQ
jgi:hypothetical protein